MIFLKLLINVGLIFEMIMCSVFDGVNNTMEYHTTPTEDQLEPNISTLILKHYNIMVAVNMQNMIFNAQITSDIVITSETERVDLEIPNLIIENLIFIEHYGHTWKSYQPYLIQSYDLGSVQLYFKYMLLPGNYSVVIQTKDVLNTNLGSNFEHEFEFERYFLATIFQLQLIEEKQSLLCWHEPAYKATFNISVSYPEEYDVLFNAQTLNVDVTRRNKRAGNRTMIKQFFTTPMVFPYSLVMMIKQLPVKTNRYIVRNRPHLISYFHFGRNIVEKVQKEVNRYLNSSREIFHTNLIVTPGKFTVTEKGGFLIYSEESFIYDEDLQNAGHKIDVARAITRGLMYQWLSKVLDPFWCKQQWFKNMFASFFQMYFLDKAFHQWQMMNFFVVQYQHFALHEIDVARNPIIHANDYFKINLNSIDINDKKGSSILRMFQQIVIEEDFQESIITFFNKSNLSYSATSDDFWDSIQIAIDKSGMRQPSKLKDIAFKWIMDAYYPIVNVRRNYKAKELFMTQTFLDEHQNIRYGSWWIPITYTTETNSNFLNTSYKWMIPYDVIYLYDFDPNGWIIVNIQQRGFYRVNYDNTNWQRIINYLNSDKYTKIHVLNRAQIIDDMYYFMKVGKITPQTFFDLIGYLKRETDYIAWYPMKKILSYIFPFAQLSIPESVVVKKYVLSIWDGLLNNVGYVERPYDDDITKLKRMFAIEWACKFGNPECREGTEAELNKLVDKLIIPSSKKMILSPFEKLIFCTGLMTASMTTWTKVLTVYKNTKDKQFLKYLACSENEMIIYLYLENVAKNNDIFNNVSAEDENLHHHRVYNLMMKNNIWEDIFNDITSADKNLLYQTVYSLIIKNHIWKDYILNYVLSNFAKLKSRKVLLIEGLTDIINNVKLQRQLNKVQEFILSELVLNTSTLNQLPLYEIENLIISRKIQIEKDLVKFKSRFHIT